MTPSVLYVGTVAHARLSPRRHRLRYRVFWMLLNLDELPALDHRLRLFAYNRFGLFSFLDADHGAGRAEALRGYVERQLRKAGIEPAGGPIRLLCMPRILGYAFNPISIYYCHAPDGSLQALLYEVNNTFGDRHSYLIPVAPGHGEILEQTCPKALHVSPFMDMDLDYTFKIAVPGEQIAVAIVTGNSQGPILTAHLSGRRRSFTDAALARLFVTHPLLTLKVIAAIHWQALRLVLKGIALRPRPQPPALAVSAIPPSTERKTSNA